MTKQLTDSELTAMNQARLEYQPYYTGYEIEERQGFRSGFIAGLSYQKSLEPNLQVPLEMLREKQAKLDKLIAFIKGEITRSEIEGLLK